MSDLLRIQGKSTIEAGERDAYWSLPLDDLFRRMDSSPNGLSSDQAQRRLKALGPASLKPKHQHSARYLLLRQFKDPLVLVSQGTSRRSERAQTRVRNYQRLSLAGCKRWLSTL